MAHRLYILMRTDMASMNPGKAMAQAAHAANDAIANLEKIGHQSDLNKWRCEGGTFGTTIVLGVDSLEQLEDVLFEFTHSNSILDPTYPVKDGKVTHLIPVVTCGWVFADSNYWESNEKAQALQLHP